MSGPTREPLLSAMRALEDRAIDCRSCRGECCTSKSNSMQITEQEGQDILEDLGGRGLLSPELARRIEEAIVDFRLDVEIPSFGARPNLRRTYTCPLYQNGLCLVSPKSKPFGCLAFNPVAPRASGLASGCRSDQNALSRCAPEGAKAPIPSMLKKLMQTK